MKVLAKVQGTIRKRRSDSSWVEDGLLHVREVRQVPSCCGCGVSPPGPPGPAGPDGKDGQDGEPGAPGKNGPDAQPPTTAAPRVSAPWLNIITLALSHSVIMKGHL